MVGAPVKAGSADDFPTMQLQTGHTSTVVALAFADDGKTLASLGDDGTLLIWNLAMQKIVASAIFPAPRSKALVIIPGTTRVLLRSERALIDWDWRSKATRRQAVSPGMHLVLSHDGSKLVVDDAQASLTVMRTDDFSVVGTLVPGHPVIALAFDASARHLVVATATVTDPFTTLLHWWDIEANKPVAASKALDGRVNMLRLDRANDQILGCGGRLVISTRASAGPDVAVHPVDLSFSSDLCLVAPDGKTVATSNDYRISINSSIRLSRLGEPARNLVDSMPELTTALAFSPAGDMLVSGGYDGKLYLWQTGARAMTATLPVSNAALPAITAMALDQSGSRLAVGTATSITQLDLRRGQLEASTSREKAWINSLTYARNGDMLLSSGLDNLIRSHSTAYDGMQTLLQRQATRWSTFQARVTYAATEDTAVYSFGAYASAPVDHVESGGTVQVRDLRKRRAQQSLVLSDAVRTLAVSPTAPVVAIGQKTSVGLWNWKSNARRTRASQWVEALAFSDDGKHLVYAESIDHNRGQFLSVLEQHSAVHVLTVPDLAPVYSWKEAPPVRGRVNHPTAFLFIGKDRLVTGAADGSIKVRHLASGYQHSWQGHARKVTGLALMPSQSHFLSASEDGSLRLWATDSKEPLLTILPGAQNGWLAYTPDGRFDAQRVEDAGAVSWRMPDDPDRLLPISMFMRQYYQPNLVRRAFDCVRARDQASVDRPCLLTQPPIAPLRLVNRVAPRVAFRQIRYDAASGEALVEVEAGGQEDVSQTNQKTATGAYDLRLFRNGQLVGQWPEPKPGMAVSADDAAWRETSRVPLEAGMTAAAKTFRVPLPTHDRGQSVAFTAYAFNEDRVKSETVMGGEFAVPGNVPLRKRRAYIITVGVDLYGREELELSFAAKDATDLSAALSRIKGYEVVPLSLLSRRAAAGMPAARHASKANMRAVLELLAGKSEAKRHQLRALPGINPDALNQLARATPDDLVIVAFSGHGYTAPDSGQFYLLPSDASAQAGFGPDVLSSYISSDELSEWLRGVDAGQMALIIDACHSAASVAGPGFKPGPMGDRGLGQLAYDKGMMVLAATQASDVAVEVGKLRQGLLTYALVRDGLKRPRSAHGRRQADRNKNGTLTLRELLQYGEQRVPVLYDEIRFGKHKVARRDAVPADPNWRANTARRAQTPYLFDFQRSSVSVVVP